MRRFFLLLTAILAMPAISPASLVTVEFTGSITNQLGFDPGLIDQSITGTYTYESDTPESTTAIYPGFYEGAVSQITADFGGNSFVVNGSGDLSIADNNPAFLGDAYQVSLAPGTGTFNGAPATLGAAIIALPFNDTLLSGTSIDTLPAIPPGTADGIFQILEGTSPVVAARITSLRVRPGLEAVPEPVSTGLLVIGGLVVGAAVRRKLD